MPIKEFSKCKLENLLIDYKAMNNWAGTNFTSEKFYESYIEGFNLYNDIVKEFNSDPANIENRFTNLKKASSVKKFLEFAEKFEHDNVVFLLVVAGTMISHAVNTIESKYYYKIMAGPFMYIDGDNKINYKDHEPPTWSGYVNNFFEGLINAGNQCDIYSNRYIPMHKLFLGVFHFYLLGDSFLIEEPHQYEFNPEREKIMLHNKVLASRLKQFFENYTDNFSDKVENNEVVSYFNATRASKFYKIYGENFIERIRNTYEFTR